LNTPHVYEWWGRGSGPDGIGGPGAEAATNAEVEAQYGPRVIGCFVDEVARAEPAMEHVMVLDHE
jgi:hypothetical protein